MDLSNFIVDNKLEFLLLNIAQSNIQISQNTISKSQETLEFQVNKQNEEFTFDIPLLVEDSWLMGVTNLQVYDTIYNITKSSNTLLISVTGEKSNEVNYELVAKFEYLFSTNHFTDEQDYNEFVITLQGYKDESFQIGKKLTLKDYNRMNR